MIGPIPAGFRRILLSIACLCLASATPATAQNAVQTPAQTDAQLNQDETILHEVFLASQQPHLNDSELADLVEQAAPIQGQLDTLVIALTPKLVAADARLAQLGPPPAANAPPEDPKVTEDRRVQSRFHTTMDSEIKRAKLLSLESQQLAGRLADQRRALVSARLWRRSNSVLDPALWRQAVANFPRDLRHVEGLVEDEGNALRHAARPSALALLGVCVLAAAALLFVVPRALRRLVQRLALRLAPTRLRRSLYAVCQVGVSVAGPVLAINTILFGLRWVDALSQSAEQFAPTLVQAVWIAALTRALGRALLAPKHPSWRLTPLPDYVAQAAERFPALIGAAAALSFVVDSFASVAALSLPASMTLECLTTLGELAAVGAALLVVGRARVEGVPQPAPEQGDPSQQRSSALWVLAALVAWVALGSSLAAILAGYAALAIFIMHQLIWDASLLGALYLLLLLTDDVFIALASPQSLPGRFARHAIGLGEEQLEQIGVLSSGLVRVALLLFGWGAILSPFGANAQDVLGRFQRGAMIFKIGDVTISPTAIVGSLALFLFGLALTRGVRSWLDNQYLPKTRWDVGARTSLSTAIGYLGVLLAAILGLAYLGISLDRIALIASALSVGIGFGLQAVIGNFVSGLILLAERPIRVGDWIAVGDAEGDVQRINVRATEILRFDKSKLIVPNSDLVSKTVRNITHGDTIGRIRITLRVSGDVDPQTVRALLIDTYKAHEKVVEDPAPIVLLTDIGANGSELDCYVYVSSPRVSVTTRSDLMFAVDAAFRAHGVQFVSSDRDVYLRPSEPLDKLIAALDAPAPPPL